MRGAFCRRAIEQRLEHQHRSANLEVSREEREAGIAQNHMKATIQLPIGMRFIPCIYNRATLHRIDALEFEKEIAALSDLETGSQELVFVFPAELSGAAHDLASNQESHDPVAEVLPRQSPWQQVIFVAPVAVATEIG